MLTLCMKSLRIGFALVVALTLSLSIACLQGDAQTNQNPKHFKVGSADVKASQDVRTTGFHVKAPQTADSRPKAAQLNIAGAKAGAELSDQIKNLPAHMGMPSSDAIGTPEADADHDGHGHGIDYYPGDVQWGLGPVLQTSTQHALYVDYTGTIAQNFGDPEGFLSDLNKSDFIHITDQYVHSNAHDRYPVGPNAAITYALSGNTLGQHDIWAILHAVASSYGSGSQHVYHLFLPQGMDTCLDVTMPGGFCYSPDNPPDFSFCGYHAAVLFSDIGVVLYSVVPYQNVLGCQEAPPNPNGIVADSTDGTLVHEVFELITDPLGTGWTNQKMDVLQGEEIGDECEIVADQFFQFPDPSFKINGKLYQAQLEYSNKGHICTHQAQ